MGGGAVTTLEIVGGLTERSSRARLKVVMEKYGPVSTVFMSSYLKRQQGERAYVKFEHPHTAELVMKKSDANELMLDGYAIFVAPKGQIKKDRPEQQKTTTVFGKQVVAPKGYFSGVRARRSRSRSTDSEGGKGRRKGKGKGRKGGRRRRDDSSSRSRSRSRDRRGRRSRSGGRSRKYKSRSNERRHRYPSPPKPKYDAPPEQEPFNPFAPPKLISALEGIDLTGREKNKMTEISSNPLAPPTFNKEITPVPLRPPPGVKLLVGMILDTIADSYQTIGSGKIGSENQKLNYAFPGIQTVTVGGGVTSELPASLPVSQARVATKFGGFNWRSKKV